MHDVRIKESEKFALIGLAVKVEDDAVFGQIAPDLWVVPYRAFTISDHWKEWLGTIRIEELEDCNAFLLTMMGSATPGVLDGENIRLKKRVWDLYVGLLLASPFAPAHAPVMLTGACQNGEADIREQAILETPIMSSLYHYPPVTTADMQSAAHIAENLRCLAEVRYSRWRLNRVLSIYVEARTTRDILDRLHQYCRCIEGLILPKAGDTKKQFKSRTELFVGPRHHSLMGDIYDIRSAIEHLHENRFLETFDRDVRLDILRKEATAEYIARTSLSRILGTQVLWSHFANTSALADFWKLSADERQRLWGAVVDPLAPLTDFKPEYVNDGELGAPLEQS